MISAHDLQRAVEDLNTVVAGQRSAHDPAIRHNQHERAVISRYPDRQTLDTRWKERSVKFDANAAAPKVGESAGWLETGAGPRRNLVFRQGLFTGWAECTVELSGEPLMELLTVTVARMARAAEPGAAPNAAVPHP